MFLEVITPDKKIFEGEVEIATFPGLHGSFQVLNHHAPLVSTLGHGQMKMTRMVDKKPEESEFTVSGGVVEVLHNHVTVLAEKISEES